MDLSDRMTEFLTSAMESVASQFGDDAEVTEISILCWHYWWFLYCESNSVTGEQPIDDIFFMLHPSLRPIPPCPTSQVSMRVYEEHRKMAKEYLEVQKELQWMTKYCNDLVEHLEETKKRQQTEQRRSSQQPLEQSELQRSVEEFVRLENEKKSLLEFHRNLKEQLSKVHREQLQMQQQQQQQQQVPQPADKSRSSPLPDDGWVVLSRI